MQPGSRLRPSDVGTWADEEWGFVAVELNKFCQLGEMCFCKCSIYPPGFKGCSFEKQTVLPALHMSAPFKELPNAIRSFPLLFYIYIYFMLLNIYIYIKKHAAPDGFETPFLSCVFQVSTNNSSWHFLVFHYSSALSTYSTLAKLFTFLLSSSLREKRVLFHLLYFWALIFLGGDAWTTAELWVAFPAFRESHRVTSQLSYITLPLFCEPKLAVREATCFVSLLKWSG